MSDPFPAELTIEGDGLRFRRLASRDAPVLLELGNDADALRFVRSVEATPVTVEESLAWASDQWEQGKVADFAIVEPPDDTMVGGITYVRWGPTRASLGYGLLPAARGRGIATRALRVLVAWAFEAHPELVRVELWIVPGNDASARVAERAGFQYEGTFRSRYDIGAGEQRDVRVYSRLRTDAG